MYHGCTSVSITVVTSSPDDTQDTDTQCLDGLTHSLNEPECVGVFTNASLLPVLLRALPVASTIMLVVYDGKPNPKLVEDLAAVRGTIRVMSIDDLRNFGQAGPSVDLESRSPKKEDVAMIAYTRASGRKGLILTHTNLVASVDAVRVLVGQRWTRGDNYLSSLPHPHVLVAFIFELYFLFIGVPIGYGRTETLADTSVRNCKGDIRALSPSIMVADPGFWEILQKAITNKMSARGWVKRILFRGSAWTKKQHIPVLAQLGDLFVFYALREATGGHLRTAVSVGGRISRRTREFLSAVLVTVIDG
jgi:long-chain acyl-CoA synthetase